MLIRETDTNFDQHLERIEKSEGEAFFFSPTDNPARFQQKVVDVVVEIEPWVPVCKKCSTRWGRFKSVLVRAFGRLFSVYITWSLKKWEN